MLSTDRLKTLRTQASLSQEDMAKLLDMSRLTYISLETGKRELKNSELTKICEIFEISKDALLQEKKIETTGTITPEHPLYKMIQVILYITGTCAGKPNVGKIVLNKLLYFADFNHYEKYWKSITDDVYIKMPMGPVPKSIDGVIALMEQELLLTSISANFHGYPQVRYIPNELPDMSVFGGTELMEINNVLEKYSDKTGKRLTDFSHEDMPRKATKAIGDSISYGLSGYRTGVYKVREENDI